MTPLRSILFVPGDSDRKIAKGLASPADALVLDLEDSVAEARKPLARQAVGSLLGELRAGPGRHPQIWVRINPLSDPQALHDLAAVVRHGPAGILLPKAQGPADVERLAHHIAALEVRDGVAEGTIRILPVVTETAAAPFSLGTYHLARPPRLFGLTWGAEDLSSDLGASSNRDDDGRWSLTYRCVRSMTLLAAKACGVQVLEPLHADIRDLEGLRRSSRAAQREGFTGRFAIHPDQVEPINEAFSPSAEEVAFARQVVAAFAAAPEAGTLSLDGKMLDRPHLVQAEKVLARHAAFGGKN